jgi:hypothetical protein
MRETPERRKRQGTSDMADYYNAHCWPCCFAVLDATSCYGILTEVAEVNLFFFFFLYNLVNAACIA